MMDNSKVITNLPCCVCGDNSSQQFFSRRYEKFNYTGDFHMRRCDGCGLFFCSPRLTDDGIAALYDANYYVFQKSDADYFARTAQIYQRTIGRLPRDVPKQAIEIGSGKGYLLAVLRALGWQTYGVEISSDAARYAKEVFDVTTFAGTTEQYLASATSTKPFPVLLCIDIIEHVLDPSRFVRDLARITAQGGYAIIDTPNGNAAHIESERGAWRGFNPFHIYVFRPDNIEILLRRAGFEIVESFSYNNSLDRKAPPVAPNWRQRWLSGLLRQRPGSGLSVADSAVSCAAVCRKLGDYHKTSDGRGELASGLRGENLVVIAQRT